jgi:hypothetical protein
LTTIDGRADLPSRIAEIFNAFQVKSWGKFLIWAFLGALYIVAGFVAFENPLLAAALLTLMLGASLITFGARQRAGRPISFGAPENTDSMTSPIGRHVCSVAIVTLILATEIAW